MLQDNPEVVVISWIPLQYASTMDLFTADKRFPGCSIQVNTISLSWCLLKVLHMSFRLSSLSANRSKMFLEFFSIVRFFTSSTFLVFFLMIFGTADFLPLLGWVLVHPQKHFSQIWSESFHTLHQECGQIILTCL